jgi:hypothetical protein
LLQDLSVRAQAAKGAEACPLWSGLPVAFTELSTRINLMLALPMDKLDPRH